MSKRRSRRINPLELIKISDAEAFQDAREPMFCVGSIVMLNSGGPLMLIVDVDDDRFTCAWRNRGEIAEAIFPRVCIHRVRDAW